jgi:Uma2 family endonuclease
MGSLARTIKQTYTYADYLTWPDDERWEIIDGGAYAMTPAPTTRHQRIIGHIFTQLIQFFRGKQCEPFIAPTDVVLDDRNIVQPDILVVCAPSKITEKNIQGTPDLIIEILSPSTSVKDRREKKQLYERFGVSEYIIMDPFGDAAERFTLIEGRYAASDIVNWDEVLQSSAFPELQLPLWDVFGKTLPTAASSLPE